MAASNKSSTRIARKARIRKKITGSSAKPRLSVFRSSNYIYAQLIDDSKGATIATCGSSEKSFRSKFKHGANKEAAKEIGKELALRAKAKKIDRVVFDRNGFAYTGRVAALAEGAREAGLQF